MRISDWSSDVCSSDLTQRITRAAVQPNDRRDRRVLVAVRAEGNRARPGIQSTLGPVEIGVADVGIESPTFLLGLSNVVHRTCLPVAALSFAGILRVSCSGTIPAPVSRCWAGLKARKSTRLNSSH